MNCCSNNCTQGRDCPARVAKAKPVMMADTNEEFDTIQGLLDAINAREKEQP
jgi:hypothetical protein